MLKRLGLFFHCLISQSRFLAQWYFRALPLLATRLSSHRQAQLQSSIESVSWPVVTLPVCEVRTGKLTRFKIRPHLGEFDFEALIRPALTYEHEVFTCIEERLPQYDVVIEIGANVGVFTLFFGRGADGVERGRKVFAFEPSREAYSRLIENLAINRTVNVTPFCCAVGDETKLTSFFEPVGHLTNGTLDSSFARQFSSDVSSTTVLMIAARELRQFIPESGRVLVKIDVEGAEARVLRGLEPLLREADADVLVEVLPRLEREMNELHFLRECFELFHVTPQGLSKQDTFVSGSSRDYLLIKK